MTPRSFVRPAAAAALLLATLAAHAAGYGSNLIVNGDAEQGTTGWSLGDPGTPLFDAVEYGPNWVQATDPGPAQRGGHLFVGGSGHAAAWGTQQVDVSALSADIAAGRVRFQLDGWLGGWTTQQDNAYLYVSFLDAAGQKLGDAQLGPMTPALRNGVSGLFFVQTQGLLPTATTQIRFDLAMERFSGGDNDGYADNLALTLAPVPEPATTALMLLGLATVGGVAARRGRRA